MLNSGSMKRFVEVFCLVNLLLLSCLVQKISGATDTITVGQGIKDGETIISAGGTFELGFFSPGMPTSRYVAIWYRTLSVQTFVWVANREAPLINKNGFLDVIKPGLLVLRNGTNGTIWQTNSSVSVQNPVAQLLDTGNLVVRDANDDNPDNFLWQSFDYPTDTLLPGMKLGRNFVSGLDVYVSSWKSSVDPAPGLYTYSLDPTEYPQKLLKKGPDLVYRTGPWNGKRFNGVRGLMDNPKFSVEVIFTSDEVYYSYKLLGSTLSRFTLTPDGVGQRWTSENQGSSWDIYVSAPDDNCDRYGLCGAYGGCGVGNSATCGCLDKFEPKNPENWAQGNWSDGCVRKKQLNCSRDGFHMYPNYKLPDTRNSTYNRSISLEECRTVCLNDCSCTAYSSLDISNGGSGCWLWFGDLIDMRVVSRAGENIYIRLASSELASKEKRNGPTFSPPPSQDMRNDGMKIKKLVIALSSSVMILLVLTFLFYVRKRTKKHSKMIQEAMPRYIHDKHYKDENHDKEIELPLFELSRLVQATENFSRDKILGVGGYGPVYWGKLEGGQEIAVKRLSERSEQGLDEFKNEAICIAKLQHRNLVKLLGCCIEGKEKILIYEFMQNKSLDYFIFDQRRSNLLDWPKRFHIIQGIARGLLYLHQDSRLRVIHRDLKASNILLDADLNPKISDFGLARSFGGNETGDNTKRVIGTQGYMSPEYAGAGLFSVKSDVFSFGVLLLEIVSGKRNRIFLHEGRLLTLLGHAWMLNREGRALELIDSNLANSSYCPTEVLRAIRVGLLCVQQSLQDRPDMSSAVVMLGNELVVPEATQPGFFMESSLVVDAEITITTVEAR